MNISKKASYIKGLMEGLKIDENKDEGKLLASIVELLDDICEEVSDVRDNIEDIWENIEDIDGVIEDIEDDICQRKYEFDDSFCVKCPNCGKEYFMKFADLTHEELESGEIKCPECKAKIILDECIIIDDEYCDCECGHKKSECDCEDGQCDCNN